MSRLVLCTHTDPDKREQIKREQDVCRQAVKASMQAILAVSCEHLGIVFGVEHRMIATISLHILYLYVTMKLLES